MADALIIPPDRRFTLDGEPVEIMDFCDANGFTGSAMEQVRSLATGEEIRYGGGAGAEFILRRVE